MGTFQIVSGQKRGGNVATYFCTADGRVLHAIAGPVDAKTLLAEAKWALDLHEKAKKTDNLTDENFAKFVREAHADWLKGEGLGQEELTPGRRVLSARSPLLVAVHRLLADHALNDIEKVYGKVWEGILKEKLSNDPVSIQGFLR